MTGTIRLLLEDFLGLMREEGELDVFLPLLIGAMGQVMVHGAQKGPRQYGVDLASVGVDAEDQKRKLFLWVVKCGDQGRAEWNSDSQSLRQSIDDVVDVYVETHLPPQFKRLPKKVLIVTNGVFLSTITETMATFLRTWERRHRIQSELVNGAKLAQWTEQHLLDEYLLPAKARTLFRRMLANVAESDMSVVAGKELILDLLASTREPTKSPGRKKKQQLTALRGIRAALTVLRVWGQHEKNLLACYRLTEFAVLATWAELHEQLVQGEACNLEFVGLLAQMCHIADLYHLELDLYYRTQDAFASILPDAVLINRRVFEELGRIAFQGCFAAWFGATHDIDYMNVRAHRYSNTVESLLKSHSCTSLPAFDAHSNAVHAALLLLVVTGRKESAMRWLHEMVGRISLAKDLPQFWPSTGSLEDLMNLRETGGEVPDDMKATSTLLPIVLMWLAHFRMQDAYGHLLGEVLPQVQEKTTPNFWSPDADFDAAVADGRRLAQHGVAEPCLSWPDDCTYFVELFNKPLDGATPIEKLPWFERRLPFIPMLAALYWELQLPREMLVQQSLAFSQRWDLPTATSEDEARADS